MAAKKYDLEDLNKKRAHWHVPLASAIPEKILEKYMLQKQAVDMYIDGYNLADIEKTTGISMSNCSKLVGKCLKRNGDSGELGYEALLGRTSSHYGSSPSYKKEFLELLTLHPELIDFIKGNYFGNKRYTLEKNMNKTTLHQKFLNECLKLGVQDFEYPFNTANKGYVSLCHYLDSLCTNKTAEAMKRENDDNNQKYFSTGIGNRYSTNALAPFSVVQVDGHIIDMEYVVEIYNEDGTIGKTIATRAWLFAVIDVATRCILGYSVSQEFNYNQYDVVDAIYNAIVPKTQMSFSIQGLEYPANGGFYSTAYPELQNVLFDVIMLDNAKSHLANHPLNKLINQLKCTVNFGSIATPETRGIIERFFGTLESRGFHKTPATTGSNIHDNKRSTPEKAALKYNITYEQMCELVEILIAEYNNTPHSALFNLTPLESLGRKIYESGMFPSMADDNMCELIQKLNLRMDKRVVRGQHSNGKHPYIQFMGAEYRSKELSLTEKYLNQEILIEYNPRDISTVTAYTAEGKYIGELVARGEFGTKSHSVQTRKNATKLARQRKLDKMQFSTPLSDYEQHLYKEGRTSRRKATKADIVRKEYGKSKLSELQKSSEAKIERLADKMSQNDELTYSDVCDLSAEELYKLMFESRRVN